MDTSQTPKRRYVLGYHTFADLEPPEFVSLAAEAGYDGVTLRLWPAYKPPLEYPFPLLEPQSPMRNEVKRRLRDTGMSVLDIEVLRVDAQLDVSSMRPLLEASADLGGAYLTVLGNDEDQSRLDDNLAALAELSAEYGMPISLEFHALNSINSIHAANAALDRLGREDALLTVDTLHLFRSGGCAADIARTDPKRLISIQLCDGPRKGPETVEAFRAESRDRQHPSLGELPLEEYVRAAPRDSAIIVEAPMIGLRQRLGLEPVVIAQDALRLTTQLVSRADKATDDRGRTRFTAQG
ncbi:sugar phosphate isomerase/epimerase [Paraburkholderia sp. LEh10]|uniref:sugar phosphate isomerase/epimerase family protein n=1 Tax=Paraburkholderia sp. LEh10 TaxID=2821353 RepID=UPI001AE4C2EF|nr:sugar phosphate isomerase/epimerase [Paraburkholderia sp. LEh10]MBP0590460.1 sugar phosphate isomerase/epimerase [Paraburkholderia sp. LEh10]